MAGYRAIPPAFGGIAQNYVEGGGKGGLGGVGYRRSLPPSVHGQNWVYLAFWRFFPSFIVSFWPKHGLSKVKNAGFYSIPAGCSVHVFRKKRAKCYYSPEFGQILLLTAYSLFNAKCNDLSQGHFPPPPPQKKNAIKLGEKRQKAK